MPMGNSSQQIKSQSDVLSDTVQTIWHMIELVKSSYVNIKEIKALNTTQEQLVITNSEKNSNLLEKMKYQSEQFRQISQTVQENTVNLVEINGRVEALDNAAGDLKAVLLDSRE